MSAMGEKESETGSLKELNDSFDDKFALASTSNLVNGIFLLAIAAFSTLYFLKENNNMDLYDKYIGSRAKGQGILRLVGSLGVMGSALQIILYTVCKYERSILGYTVSVTVSAHWTTWVAMVLFLACLLVDLLVLNKKQK